MSKVGKDVWSRINVSKILFEKVDKDAKDSGRISGARVVDDFLFEYVKDHGL